MASKQMTAEQRAKVFKALSDPRRLEIVEQLVKGSESGTVLAEKLGISVALLSHHWEVLVQAGVLRKERQGQLRVCSLNCEVVTEAMTLGGAWQLIPPETPPTLAPKKKKAAKASKRAKASAQ